MFTFYRFNLILCYNYLFYIIFSENFLIFFIPPLYGTMSKDSEYKEWAEENLKGIENQLMPSFKPNMEELDEEGIRWDVRHTIQQGFSSTLCTCEAGLSFEESKRFVEIAADEAGDDLHVSTTLMFDSLKQNKEMIQHAEKAGLDTVLMGYPLNWYPDSPKEVYKVTKEMCDLADIGVILYPSPKFTLERFHPSGFPIQLLDQMADIPNAIGIKIGAPEMMDLVDRMVGDRLKISNPWEGQAPANVRKYDMQWMGAGPYDVYQTPDKPYLADYFEMLLEDKWDEAMELYWRLKPIREVFFQQMQPQFRVGNYHFPLHKYYQWLVGGNGGYTRQPAMSIDEKDKMMIRQAMRRVGLDIREDDEEFYVGRVNYEG